METNYVYKERRGEYNAEQVAKLPAEKGQVPACFEALCKFVPRHSTEEDTTTALGPSGSTTAAHEEREAPDAAPMDSWVSWLEDANDEGAELSALSKLQESLETVEKCAARVVSNELQSRIGPSSSDSHMIVKGF